MISKNQISYVKSLAEKKFRVKYGCFAAEGNKIAVEILNSNWAIEHVFATIEFVERNQFQFDKSKINIVSKMDIDRISNLFSPTDAIVIAKMPEPQKPDFTATSWSLGLDTIQDPGNLGTIIRTADWFGIHQIFASPECVDLFNSKTIQSSMGSFLRVKVIECDLEKLIAENHFSQIAGAVLNGKNIFETNFQKSGLMILGNEGKGIRESLLNKINLPITIPAKGKAESLNVAVAAGIVSSVLVK